MEIKILGLSAKINLKYKKIVEYFIFQLKMNELLKNRQLIVSFRKVTEGLLGFAEIPAHRRPDVERFHKKFRICIREKEKQKIKILIHELVHIKQYLTGKLRYVKEPHKPLQSYCLVYWRKNKLGRLSRILYEDQPWEREATKKAERYWSLYKHK